MSHPIPPPPVPTPVSAPPRSTTAPTSRPPQHHHHIHRPHRSHHHHHHHRDKSVPQSAILPTSSNPFKDNSLGDLLSPITKVGSRFEHLNRHEKEREESERTLVEDEEVLRRKEKAKEGREREAWKEVERRRRRRVEGEQNLKKKLAALSTLSTATTRRLDYTHYSLLSHVSSLVSTLSALSSLSSSTSSHLHSFENSTNEYARTAQNQLSHFDKVTFATHKERAEGLERRVKDARSRVEMLEKRLSGVREKVEGEEQGERERGRRIQWRWRCVVGTLVGVLGLLVLGGIARFGERGVGGWGNESMQERDRWEPGGGVSPDIGDTNMTMLMDERMSSESRMPQTTKTAQVRGGDEWEPRLRMLEEL